VEFYEKLSTSYILSHKIITDYNMTSEEDPIYIIKQKVGFPQPFYFKDKYIQVKDINENKWDQYIDQEMIILFKYKFPIFGTYEKEYWYKCVLFKTTETHIYIKDKNNNDKTNFLSKSRFKKQLEVYIQNPIQNPFQNPIKKIS